MYNRFTNISARLGRCGKDEEGKSLLLRIIRARMVFGFPDPDDLNSSHCTMGLTTIDAYGDYTRVVGSNQRTVLEELLKDAKASGKPTNVIFVLRTMNQFSGVNEGSLSTLEEIEKWKIKANNPMLLFCTMMQIADWNVYFNHFDKAEQKWKQAVDLVSTDSLQKSRQRIPSLSGYLKNLGKAFTEKDQLGKAGDVYIAAYGMALHEPKEYQAQTIAKAIDVLSAKYREQGDEASGESLLKTALRLSKAERGSDSLLERMWLIKLADFYATAGEKEKTKIACSAFMNSINKPGLTVSKVTVEGMEEHVKLLTKTGFLSEANVVANKLNELESQQCHVTGSGNH